MNFPMKGFSTRFISLINVLEALLRPNNITSHSYNPFFVMNVVFHLSLAHILINWLPLLRSILEKFYQPLQLI